MKKAILYWIRLPEHTDPETEGYIGVTSKLETRLNHHCREANNNTHKNPHLSFAIKKYGWDNHIFEVIDETRLNPKYLYFILTAMKEEVIASLMTGTSNVSLDKDDLHDLEIPCPSIDLQNEIVSKQEILEFEINKMKQEINKMNEKLIIGGKSIWN